MVGRDLDAKPIRIAKVNRVRDAMILEVEFDPTRV